MRRILAKAMAMVLFALVLGGAARAQFLPGHVITISGNGQVFGTPDLGILVLVLESSAPLAADAVRQNASKASDVQGALAALGYGHGSFQVTPVIFTRAGGPYYGPNQPSITGIQAQQFIYVFFEGDQLKDQSQFSPKVAAVVDALTKSGAAASNPFPQQQSAMIVYTVKDPVAYENQALQQALGRARETVQRVAKGMGVEITGLHSLSTGFVGGGGVGGMIGPYPQVPPNALAELPYHYYSTRADQVAITGSVTLNYDFK